MFSYLLCSTDTINGVININQNATVSAEAVFYREMDNLRAKGIPRFPLDPAVIASHPFP